MDILQILHQARSKERNNRIIQLIGAEQNKFDELLSYFDNSEVSVKDSIIWIMSDCVKNHPNFLDNHYTFVVQNLQKPATNGVERSLYRALQYVKIPEKYQGIIVDLAFDNLSSSNSGIANKIFAMTVLFNISTIHTDLQHELTVLIEHQLPYGSTGFKNRGNKILKAIKNNRPTY